MDEKFSVSLELALNKWKSQMATVKKSMQNIGKVAKSSIAIDDSSIRNMTAQQELLKNKILDIQQTLTMANQDSKLFSPSEVLEMRVELEKLENQLNDTTKSSTAFKKVGDNISNTMKKGMQSAKKFTLSLFGIHSIYRMLSRASSAYLAQDQETSNKIQAAWIGLGSVFAPLLQMIANFAIKAVSYFNIFIKALTGVDFLGNAMAKSMNKANKSAGKLSKTLAGFDEITNLDSDAGGIGAGTADWVSEFNNVKLNPKLVEFFKNLGETLKPLKDNLVEIGLTLLGVFTGAKLLSILAGIGGIAGVAGLATIAVAEIAAAIWLVIYATKELDYIEKRNDETNELRTKHTNDYIEAVKKKLAQGDMTLEQAKTLNKASLNSIDNLIVENKKLGEKATFWEKLTGIDKQRQEQMEVNNKLINDEIGLLMRMAQAGKLGNEERERLISLLKAQREQLLKTNSALNENSTEYKINSTRIQQIDKDLKAIGNKDYKATLKVEADTTGLSSRLKSMVESLAKMSFGAMGNLIPESTKNGILKLIAKLDTGTSYVPNNQLAMIHQGEAVIPKKFNSREYFGMGNDDTNELLKELIDRVENIEINPYTTIKDVGTASVNYINNQNRVMGRGVI